MCYTVLLLGFCSFFFFLIRENLFGLVWFGLVVFYGILTILGYLMFIYIYPVYIYIYIYIYICLQMNSL